MSRNAGSTNRVGINRNLAVIAGVALTMACIGCAGTDALYLHNDADEQRAKTALATLDDKIDLNNVAVIGRANVESLAAAQREVDQAVTKLAASRDIVSLLTYPSSPQKCGEAVPVGWKQLVCETSTALSQYGLATEGDLRLTDRGEAVDFIKIKFDRRAASRDREIQNTFARHYKQSGGTRKATCSDVMSVKEFEATNGEGEPAWDEYEDLVVHCERVKPVFSALLSRNPHVADLNKKITALKKRRDALTDRDLDTRYGKLEKQRTTLAADQTAARKEDKNPAEANGTSESDSPAVAPAASAVLEKVRESDLLKKTKKMSPKEQLDEWVAGINSLLAESKERSPILNAKIKGDLATELRTRIQNTESPSDLGGRLKNLFASEEDGLGAIGQAILAILRSDREINERLPEKGVLPSPNLLSLEIALHRLRQDTLSRELASVKAELAVRDQMLASYELELFAWIQTAEAAVDIGIKTQRVDEYFEAQKKNRTLREQIAKSLVYYAVAKSNGPEKRLELESELTRLIRLESLDRADAAIQIWNDVLRAPIQEIATYFEGGFTAEEIAAFLTAVGVAVVAGGVY